MVKRWVLTALILLSLGMSQAQGSYVGVGASVLTNISDGAAPLFSLQVAGPVAETLELRGTLDTLLFLSVLGADMLYPFAVAPTLKGYAGGGADFAYIFLPGLAAGGTLTRRAAAGLKVRTGGMRIYGEVQPYTLLSAPILALKARSGVNFYF